MTCRYGGDMPKGENMLSTLEQYKKTSVNTMTRGELLILLFDEAIKKLNQSKLLMEHEDYANANIYLTKVRHIFYYLIATLDGKYQVSRELSDMYLFLNREIMKASSLSSTKHIDDILPIIKELRNTWAEADILARRKY